MKIFAIEQARVARRLARVAALRPLHREPDVYTRTHDGVEYDTVSVGRHELIAWPSWVRGGSSLRAGLRVE
jgi:hypothetical protein